jgi:cytidylate kinase
LSRISFWRQGKLEKRERRRNKKSKNRLTNHSTDGLMNTLALRDDETERTILGLLMDRRQTALESLSIAFAHPDGY